MRIGIAKEKIDFMVGEVDPSKVDLQKLIDPSMIILSDYNKEENMDVLNNSRNYLLDNFRSIKWLFHQVMDLKEMMGSLEGRIDSHRILDTIDKKRPMMGSLNDMENFYRLEAKVLELKTKVNGIASTLRGNVD